MKANMYEQMMYLPGKGPLRALEAQLNTQQHSVLESLHPWQRAQALLACLTQSMEWNHSLLSPLWQLQSANQWPLAHLTLVCTSWPFVPHLVPIIGPLLLCALFQCLAIPCHMLEVAERPARP